MHKSVYQQLSASNKPLCGKYFFPAEGDVIISILRSTAGLDSNIGYILQKKQIDWREFKNLISYHELAPLAYTASKRFDSLCPKDLYALLQNTYYHDIARSQKLQQEFRRISEAFNRAGVMVLPIKGMALIYDAYLDFPARPMVDIDILVKEPDIEQGQKILADLGYTRELLGCTQRYWREKQIHFTFYKKNKTNVIVELHWGLDFKRRNCRILPNVWERTRSVGSAGAVIRLLSSEDTLFSLVLHARRFGKALCLKYAYDIYLLLDKHKNSFDWEYCLAMCGKYRLYSVLFFSLHQVKIFSYNIVPERIWKGLRVSGFKRMLIERFIEKNIFKANMAESGKKMYLISHFLLYDSFWEPLEYIINIPKEQFAKYYMLRQYSFRSNFFYTLRLLYMPAHWIFEQFFHKTRSAYRPNEAFPEPGIKMVRAWGWSMYPNIIDGDRVILKQKKYSIGDVIAFKGFNDQDILHRVVAICRGNIVTRGDNSIANDKPIAKEEVTGTAIALMRDNKLYPIKKRVLYIHMPCLQRFVVFCRKVIKRIIVFLQDTGPYKLLIKSLLKNVRIDLEGPVEAKEFYFIRAMVNNRYAGYIKIDKNSSRPLFIYVKIWYRHLGVEDKLREFRGQNT